MSFAVSFTALFRRMKPDDRAPYRPLYRALVREARDPFWYRDGAVADTLDGRFDALVLALSLTLLRMEAEGEAGRLPAARLTEVFVEDMEGQVREIGFGDLVVGKQVGRMMAALGGRLNAYRDGPLEPALIRNLYCGTPPDPQALALTMARIETLRTRLAQAPLALLLNGGF